MNDIAYRIGKLSKITCQQYAIQVSTLNQFYSQLLDEVCKLQ